MYTHLRSRVGTNTETPARVATRERFTPAPEEVRPRCPSDVRVHLQPEQLEFVDADMGALRRERREASYMSFMRLDAILISTERHFFRRAGLDDAAEHLEGCFPSDMLRLV